MWISGGDHELAENIVHLVLAKIPGLDGALIAGTRGISLFIVPKRLVDVAGNLTGERNDVALAGLNHKLGFRGLPNALLNFGEGRFVARGSAGAIGYLVGRPGEGLSCMFHMMNEARISVGMGAVALGYAGYEASLEYARTRRQGRPYSSRRTNVASPPVRIVEHADVRRMLLAQKAYVDGGLALELYCARLVDEARTGSDEDSRRAANLLEVLTPVAKSWPSEWCLEADGLAIQVHGGYGYTRDFPVEQYWRDDRLNMIHEGTHGIQGLDLLGRKVLMDGGAAFSLLRDRIGSTVRDALAREELADYAAMLDDAVASLRSATDSAWETSNADGALANATPYLQAFGHVVVAWLWLDVMLAACRSAAVTSESRANVERGLVQAGRFSSSMSCRKPSRGWVSSRAAESHLPGNARGVVLTMSRHIRELFDLTGQKALVTGGSRGLGLQVAEALGEAGATVLLTSRKQAELETAVASLAQRGIKAQSLAGDASQPEDIERICTEALARLGGVDILVNNAGATWGAPAEDYPLAAWDKVMNLNVRSAFLFSQYLAKHSMIPRRSGRILMMASGAGLAGNTPGQETVAYNTSKAALINMTRALAGEWGEFGITVNALAPGPFPTKMTRGTIEARGLEPIVARIPLRRLGDDEDLKGTALLFAAPAGKHITGQVLAVDGGLTAVIG